uniref:Zinc finger FYVE domain-containing protein n=1 Tax=Sphenodon punctatus TaxID=8508 RepID=A0A8D0L1S8_SPHPU
MDSYFKAAVCDLDKLLDEFEQNAGQLAVCATLSCNLLSTVDGGTSGEIQPSCLGRCSIPICDLISDTGNLIHVKTSPDDIQKLQPGDFECNKDSLIGFDLSLVPATVCSSSVDHRGNLSTKHQNDGESELQDTKYVAIHELSHLPLKTDSHAKASCGAQNRSETLLDNEMFDQLEQNAGFKTSAFITRTSNVHSSKDGTTNEKLLCKPLIDENANCAISQERDVGINENVASNGEGKAESVLSDLPKSYELHKNILKLTEKCSLPGSLSESVDVVVLDKIQTVEEKFCRPVLDTSETLYSVSTSQVSEDVQTSLSCLPLALSMCGSLVATENKSEIIPMDEEADVISDTMTVHAGKSKSDFPKRELYGKTESSEQEGLLNKTNQSFVEEANLLDKERGGFDKISKGEFSQLKAPAATLLVAAESHTEIYNDGIQSTDNCGKSTVDPTSADWAIEEGLIKSETLISDAELDAFLSEQCLQPSNSKSFEVDAAADLLESDANQLHTINVNNLDVKKVSTQTKLESIREFSAINNACRITDTEDKLVSSAEKSTYPVHKEDSNHIGETGSETLSPAANQQNVHSGGARPKQLLFNLPPKTGNLRELSNRNVLERENQANNSVEPKASPLDTETGSDTNAKCNHADMKNCLEVRGSCMPANLEPVQVTEQIALLGQKQPPWVPDSEAPNFMNCQVKFTFVKRRHHCRACGKVFCSDCCSRRSKLQYMEKEARVCVGCYESISKAQAFERMMSPTGSIPNSNISSEDCSAVPPLQESQESGTPDSPSVLPISVLKQPSVEGLCLREQRRVWFADGILPNGEVADTTKLSSGVKRSSQDPSPISPDLPEMHMEDFQPHSVSTVVQCVHAAPGGDWIENLYCPNSVVPDTNKLPMAVQTEMLHSSDSEILAADELPLTTKTEKSPGIVTTNQTNEAPVRPSDYRMLCGIENCVSKKISLIPEDDGLPPLLLAGGEKGEDPIVDEHPCHKQISSLLAEGPNPLTFILNANLLVNVKLLSYCSEKCWYFSTNGLHGLGQAEIIILLLHLPNEDIIPKEIFTLFVNIYKDAMKGKLIENFENITFTESFLGSKDHGGFLFVKPTYQKLDDLLLPNNPFLCGILIQKLEIPWAKVFPIRLMLRLGAEYGAYPTPLTSVRHRKPLFGEIGHTIMNLLVDLRNYQYTLHTIDNLFIHMEMGKSCIKIPLERYNEVMKVINSSNEHVLSIGASFSTEADSHLVCVQNDDGVYQTQANSATGNPRRVTGASFVVFNGALKTSSGFLAKSSIVEDGLMVQITPETMDGLRQSLREKKDFKITCGKVDAVDLREYVDICWVESEEKINSGITSPLDGKSMEGIQSKKILQGGDFEKQEKLVKCTEVFYLLKDQELSSQTYYHFAKEIAVACSAALCPHLKTLKKNAMNKIGLRVSIDTDMVEYQAGSGGQLLHQHYLNDLDNALIPVIHGGTLDPTNLPLEIELIFFLVEYLS